VWWRSEKTGCSSKERRTCASSIVRAGRRKRRPWCAADVRARAEHMSTSTIVEKCLYFISVF
jgi:hypothetical protein